MLYQSETLNEIVSKLKTANNEDICIITDFDDTLTKGILNNEKRGSNSFSVFANNPNLLNNEYIIKTNKLFKHYYEIEQDPKILPKEKTKAMIEWWGKEFELYKEYKLNKQTLNQIIENKLIEIKPEVKQFLIQTNKFQIPTIIFSAGIYNLIHGFLNKINSDYSNIHVVANIFEFDQKNKFFKTKGDIIHSLNKTFEELSHLQIYEELKNKKNCILIGDSISDLKMIQGSNFENILKIGFLNKLPKDENYQERLNAHIKNYDIVLHGTEDFSKINQILKEILE